MRPVSSLSSVALAATLLAAQAAAHTYMVSPKGRLAFAKGFSDSSEDGTGSWDGLCHLGDGTATCCGTDKIPDSQQESYKRGDEVSTRWWRNNHAGGFIRYSIVAVDQSDSQDAFDSAENVISYSCSQVGCDATYGGDAPNSWNGGDSQGSKGWSNQCKGSFFIPYHLKDGTYTLQWIWFATGNAPSANSPFQTCMDFKIAGGPAGAQPSCPLWKGGDLSEKSPDACSYVSVNNPSYQGVCKEANACQGSYEVGVPKAIQDCNAGVKPSTYSLEMVSAPNGFPDTFTAYTASGSFNSSAPSSNKPVSSTKSPASSTKTPSSSAARSPSTKAKAKAKTCKTWQSHARRRFRLVRS